MKIEKYRTGIKRLAVFFLCAAVTAGALLGCNGGSGEGKKADASAKGRYVEEDVVLPIQEGEEVLNLTKSEEGNPVLFSCRDGVQIVRYEYKTEQWEETPLEWISRLYEGKNLYYQEVQETKDGICLVRSLEEAEGGVIPHIARSKDGQNGEDLAIPFLTRQSEFGSVLATNLLVDGAGNYWINDMYESKIAVIDSESLETIQELNTAQIYSGEQRVAYPAEDGSVAVNTEEGVFTLYDQELKEQGTIQAETGEDFQMCNEGTDWYLISEEGIIRTAVGNDSREIILDGSMGAMGSSSNSKEGIIRGPEKDFYVLYRQGQENVYKLLHYVYDAEISAVPEHTLQVFGLSENNTIQEAIIGFQKSHPDMRVDYQVSGNEEGISTDDIRTLNTELLSGNGADVLLLDGLPTEAYIEKGILEDLTGIAEELMEENSYLETILKNTAQKDGKIYGMPVKFGVPIIYGNLEVKNALRSLDNLKAYLDSQPGASIFGVADRAYIRDFLFQIYQDEILDTDGKVDQEKLAALLELEKKIMVNARAEVFDETDAETFSTGIMQNVFHQGMFSNPGSAALLNHPDCAATDRINCITDMMIPYTVMRQLEIQPESLRNLYLPLGIAGINKNTKQKEAAEEFVKYLFSQEVQGVKLDDGFPVLRSTLEDQRNEVGTEYAENFTIMSSWMIDGEDAIEIEARYPSAEEVDDLIAMCDTLQDPAEQDCVIWGIYQTEAEACLGGSIDAETAAKNIAQKVDTYLAE